MQTESFELGEYSVHPSLNAVKVNGREIGVESKAMEVLVYLASQPEGKHFSYATAWDYGSSTSQVCVFRLSDRKVFEVTDGKTLDWNPTWSADGPHLYFISNRGGSMDLWQQSLTAEGVPYGSPESITVGMEMRYAAFSADGKRLAYSKGRNISNVWRIPVLLDRIPTWADARQLTSDHSGLANVEISPDLEHLTFTVFRDGQRHIWLLKTDGSDLQRFTTDPMNQVWPRWSPDGKSIAFHSEGIAGDSNIWVAPVNGGTLSQLTHQPGWDTVPAWSPDGERIAFNSNRAGNWDIWTVSVQTREEKQLTNHQAYDYACCNNAWSPDGREIVFSSTRNGTSDIWIVSVEDGKERQVTSEPRREGVPRWSPDGKWLLYDSGPPGAPRLWRVRPSGGKPEPLPEGSHQGIWSRDGKTIYFHLRQSGLENIYEMTPEGGRERQMTDLKGKPGVLNDGEFQTDGRFFYFTWREEVGDLWIMDVKTKR